MRRIGKLITLFAAALPCAVPCVAQKRSMAVNDFDYSAVKTECLHPFNANNGSGSLPIFALIEKETLRRTNHYCCSCFWNWPNVANCRVST